LRAVRPGWYVTPDGRYSLRRGTGWCRDLWTLRDHATGLAATHHGKRAALTALAAALTVAARATPDR
jgi:hypothetical protein